jgi:hypothetical protein
MFKLGITNTNKEGELIAWFSISNINYIKNLGKAIYNANYVLNLNFSQARGA